MRFPSFWMEMAQSTKERFDGWQFVLKSLSVAVVFGRV